MALTQKEVARMLGMSQTTVSMALSGSPRVSDQTKETVKSLCKRLGYHPNYSATSLVNRRTMIISVLIHPASLKDIHSRWMGTMQQEAVERGYRIRLDPATDLARIAAEQSADAFIVFDKTEAITHASGNYGGIPLVFVGCPVVDDKEQPVMNTVGDDNRGAALQLMRYLAGLGHEKVLFFGLVPGDKYSGERYWGYEEGLREIGGSGNPTVIHIPDFLKDPDMVLPYSDGLERAIREGCTAVMTTSDDMAIGVMKVLKGLGYRIPEDVSVTGFDDIMAAKVIDPPLTTMREESEIAARALIAMVMELIAGKGPQRSVSIPMSLKTRGSTGPTKRVQE